MTGIPITTIDECNHAEAIVRKALSIINHRRRILTLEDEIARCEKAKQELADQREKMAIRIAEYRRMRAVGRCGNDSPRIEISVQAMQSDQAIAEAARILSCFTAPTDGPP